VLRVFENRMLRMLFRSKTDKVTRYWRRLHNEEHYGLNSSLNIIRVNKARRMRKAGHVANMETGEMHSEFWLGNIRKRGHLEDLGVDGRMI
jgi:hypothetical protein